jgi:hypothetical protein
MARFTVASHNLLFKLDDRRWRADLDKSTSRASLLGFQEANGAPTRKTLHAYLTEHGFDYYAPRGTDCHIAWNPDIFEPIEGEQGNKRVHDSAGFMRYNPARYLTWKGFVHKPTGKRVLFYNIHPTAGFTKPEDKTDWGPKANEWKNEAARDFYTTLLAHVARKMNENLYDVIIIGGDWNASLRNEGEWYFPGALFDGLIVEHPKEMPGLDHIVITVDSDATIEKRYAVREGVHSDHALHFATIRL